MNLFITDESEDLLSLRFQSSFPHIHSWGHSVNGLLPGEIPYTPPKTKVRFLCGVAVARVFDCNAYIIRHPQLGAVVMLAGYKTDVKVAGWTLDYLLDCINNEAEKFRFEATKFERARKMVDDFRYTMAATLCSRLKELDEEKEKEVATNEKSTALVVAKEAAIGKRYGQPSYSAKKRKSITAAALAGQEAGKRVALNTPVEYKDGVKRLT